MTSDDEKELRNQLGAFQKEEAAVSDDRVVAWLCENGNPELAMVVKSENAMDAYAILGRTITPLVPLSALQAAEHEVAHWKNYYGESVECAREWIAKFQAAEQRNAALVARVVAMHTGENEDGCGMTNEEIRRLAAASTKDKES